MQVGGKSDSTILNKIKQAGGGGALIIADYRFNGPPQRFEEMMMKTYLAGLPVTHWPQMFGRDKRTGEVKILTWPGSYSPGDIDCGNKKVSRVIIPVTLDESGVAANVGKPKIIPPEEKKETNNDQKIKEEYVKNPELVISLYLVHLIDTYNKRLELPKNKICNINDYTKRKETDVSIPIERVKVYGDINNSEQIFGMVSLKQVCLSIKNDIRYTIYDAALNCKDSTNLVTSDNTENSDLTDFGNYVKNSFEKFVKVIGDDKEVKFSFFDALLMGKFMDISVIIMNNEGFIVNAKLIPQDCTYFMVIMIYEVANEVAIYNVIGKWIPAGNGIQFVFNKKADKVIWERLMSLCEGHQGEYTNNTIGLTFNSLA